MPDAPAELVPAEEPASPPAPALPIGRSLPGGSLALQPAALTQPTAVTSNSVQIDQLCLGRMGINHVGGALDRRAGGPRTRAGPLAAVQSGPTAIQLVRRSKVRPPRDLAPMHVLSTRSVQAGCFREVFWRHRLQLPSDANRRRPGHQRLAESTRRLRARDEDQWLLWDRNNESADRDGRRLRTARRLFGTGSWLRRSPTQDTTSSKGCIADCRVSA